MMMQVQRQVHCDGTKVVWGLVKDAETKMDDVLLTPCTTCCQCAECACSEPKENAACTSVLGLRLCH
jgi:hypothetical protein